MTIPTTPTIPVYPTVTDVGAVVPAGHIATSGILTVYVPGSSWHYLTPGPWPAPAEVAARVCGFIRGTLLPEAGKIMVELCAGAGATFTPDPLHPQHDLDRHGLAVHGRLS